VITHRYAATDYEGGARLWVSRRLRQGRAHLVRSVIWRVRRCSLKSRRASAELEEIRSAGLFSPQRVIVTPHSPPSRCTGGREVLNLCANNTLGLADDPRVVAAGEGGTDRWGYGMASCALICRTRRFTSSSSAASRVPHDEDSILYSSCFDANGACRDAARQGRRRNQHRRADHASIIDGIGCAAPPLPLHNRTWRTSRNNCNKLRCAAQADSDRRCVLDDGYVSPLAEICELAERYDAMVMVDDSHAVGSSVSMVVARQSLHDVADRVDIVTARWARLWAGAKWRYVSAARRSSIC